MAPSLRLAKMDTSEPSAHKVTCHQCLLPKLQSPKSPRTQDSDLIEVKEQALQQCLAISTWSQFRPSSSVQTLERCARSRLPAKQDPFNHSSSCVARTAVFLTFNQYSRIRYTSVKMHLLFRICTFALFNLVRHALGIDCPCGWLVEDQDTVYTHHLHDDFSSYPIDVDSLLDNPLAAKFNEDWMIYDY